MLVFSHDFSKNLKNSNTPLKRGKKKEKREKKERE